MINCNSDSLSESGGKSCGLQFLVSKASSVSYLGVVLFSAGLDKRSELLEWSWERTSSLGNSSGGSNLLVSCLIEINSNSTLPVLSQVNTSEHIVVLDHCLLIY